MKKKITIILSILITILIIQIPNISALNSSMIKDNINTNIVDLIKNFDMKQISIKGFFGTILFILIWIFYLLVCFFIGIPVIIITGLISLHPNYYFKPLLSSIWFVIQGFFDIFFSFAVSLWE